MRISATVNLFRAGLVGGVSLAGLMAMPAMAQGTKTAAVVDTGIEEIVVTAQRTAQSLQDVPISVSAFSAESLQKQQINTSSDLQLTLPNITFTKTNFTSSSFTIRGVGDLCTGNTCDAATGIAVNDMPLFGTRLFETEFFDLERVEVLRGPQGTLFGRNATSGVVNFITAKPTMDAIHASGEGDYGNYNSIRVKGMLNLPVTDRFAVRAAGFYLKRDGYTTNTFDNTKIDGRDLYALRGSARWEPTDNTTVDAMAYYFHEKDDRSRIQKQLCDPDPTGILGCLPGQRTNGVVNGNASLGSIFASKELFALKFAGTPAAALAGTLALGSLYGPNAFTGTTNPADLRTVNTAFRPQYSTSEQQYMLRVQHDFGSIKAQLSGMYQSNKVDSLQDYNVQAANPAQFVAGLTGLQFVANNLIPSLKPVAAALIPNGPNGPYCTSNPDASGGNVFTGNSTCGSVPLSFDRSNAYSRTLTLEGIVESKFDGKFNFLLGGIYNDLKSTDTDYYVDAFGLDYPAGIFGAIGGTPTYLATPYYRNNSARYTLKSYGIFGEAYFALTDRLKITAGLRYNNDKKFVSARTSLINTCPTPIGQKSDLSTCADFDPYTPGSQPFADGTANFEEMTGRFVVDWKIGDESLLYASYSRGYKSGGINPPLSLGSGVPSTFAPEFVDAFEVGSKNTFLNGTLRANLTAFYYKYKGLQISSIQQRTSVNQNINADIYGVEGEFVIQPVKALTINLTASYLHAKAAGDQYLVNPADPSGGNPSAVIIKDVTTAENCTVVPTGAGGSALTNGYVSAVNAGINAATGAGLRAPVAFPAGHGLPGTVTGAYSICASLAASAAPSGVAVFSSGVPFNVRNAQLPQAPTYKFSAGIQYVVELPKGMSVTPRVDLAYTGESFGSIFNTQVNRIQSYSIVNSQIQLDGADKRWYLRAYVQNLLNNNATTGLYVTAQASGLFSNVFTLEPRRYGAAVGFKF